MEDLFKLFLILVVASFVLGFAFKILFKIGILILIGLGGLYLYKKVFVE